MEKTVLLPSMDAVIALRKQEADSNATSCFATSITTPRAWLSDLWDAYGDGRCIASHSEKMMAAMRALCGIGGFERLSYGAYRLVAKAIEGGLGSLEFDRALCGEVLLESLPAGASFLLDCTRAYEHALDEAGLVDSGRAWQVLSCERIFSCEDVVELRGVWPSVAMAQFFANQGVRISGDDSLDHPITPLGSTVDVKFAFPSGRYAEPALLAQFAVELSQSETVAIAAREPFDCYKGLASRLKSRGIAAACRAHIPFTRTAFGRAYSCAVSLVQADGLDVQAACDFALNPFSRMSRRDAFDFGARLRGDRLIDKEACLTLLRTLSPSFDYFEELALSCEAAMVAGVFEDSARAMESYGDAFVGEQLAAIGALRDVYCAAASLHASLDACVCALGAAKVDASRTSGEDPARVTILSQGQLADCAEGSFDWVLLADMTSAAYPIKEEHDAATELLEALGVAQPPRALAVARSRFMGCLKSARKGIVVERCLNDENANATYPAAVVQEFVDCYREDPTNLDDIDNPYSLPAALLAGLMQRGEQLLHENESANGRGPRVLGRVATPDKRRITSALLPEIVLSRSGGGDAAGGPCFSASQIESYLECPQKWFALRRLRLDELDEGFGAKEKGEFAHGVLEGFYAQFQREVAPKVTADTLPAAREMMNSVIAAHEAAQREMKPLSNRLIATSELETREFEELKRKLVCYLDAEASLLPDFRPAYFEYEILSSAAVPYAGHSLMGKIDRIDVDDRGRAVIIDYKSSLSAEYDLYESEKRGGAMREGKVQALIYAQAIRRLLGFEVVGALYVSYGRTRVISGAIDKSIEPIHVPGLKPDRCCYKGDFGPNFSDLLDATEARVAAALEELLGGNVAALPHGDAACSFCPEIMCPQRRR